MIRYFACILFLFSFSLFAAPPKVKVGVECLFSEGYVKQLKNKRIGLITNHTAVNYKMQSTANLLKENASKHNYTLTTLFAPEHGIDGSSYAEKATGNQLNANGIPVISLYGENGPKRLTKEMLGSIDILIYDIQDIGSRSYTYISTLFYAMEEAAKRNVPVMVLDRPNPINGITVDGPMLEQQWRSVVGYINVPYCHGMTIGELAEFFNYEYKVGCRLTVVPMKGWLRTMNYSDTGLKWVPTSPHMPEASTALYYPTTGILGELQLVNIGVGYTLPFKLVGAPWIDAEDFAYHLNKQKFPGVHFQPFYYRPFYGRFAQQDCQGVLIIVSDPRVYKPVSTQYLIIGILKGIYPNQFKDALLSSEGRRDMFCKVNGTDEAYKLITEGKHIVYKLKAIHEKEREDFLKKRKKYLNPHYSQG